MAYSTSDFANFDQQKVISKIIKAYAAMVKERVDNDWNPYLMTFMFKPLSGNRASVSTQMLDEIDRVYSTFITRADRNPRRSALAGKIDEYYGCLSGRDRRPILIACLDGFCRKNERKRQVPMDVNDGLHAHGVLVVPWNSRIKTGIDKHFRDKKDLYVRNRLLRIDVRPIDSDLSFTVSAVLTPPFMAPSDRRLC